MVQQPREVFVGSGAPTVGSCLTGAVERLESNGILEFRLKAEWILSRVLKCRRLELPLQRDRELNGIQLKQIASLVRRVAAGEPIQYALGDTEFMGRVFKTDSRALIPRPETEILVEQVLASEDAWSSKHPAVADVGTGSGCIVVTLALEKPDGEYLAIDVSVGALELARENAATLGVERKITFARSDLLENIPLRSLNLVVSNPPYVSTDDIETLQPEIRDHEPRLALDGGPDGMNVISKLIPQAFGCLRSGGWLFMEIGEDQGERVRDLMRKNRFEKVEIRKDEAGHDRIACGGRPL